MPPSLGCRSNGFFQCLTLLKHSECLSNVDFPKHLVVVEVSALGAFLVLHVAVSPWLLGSERLDPVKALAAEGAGLSGLHVGDRELVREPAEDERPEGEGRAATPRTE